jgi:hypothetical protein
VQKTRKRTGSIRFVVPRAGAPAALVAEVEIPIGDGALAGMKLTGIRGLAAEGRRSALRDLPWPAVRGRGGHAALGLRACERRSWRDGEGDARANP